MAEFISASTSIMSPIVEKRKQEKEEIKILENKSEDNNVIDVKND